MKRHKNFLGIDLSRKNPSAYFSIDEEAKVLSFGFFKDDGEILEFVEKTKPSLIAIDSPLALPKGLCCLEENCSCFSPLKVRTAERELATLGFPCFFTTKKSIIKGMVIRGISLRKRLEAMGYEVVEVYPYASKIRLFKKRPPPKTRREGRLFLQEEISLLFPSLPRQVVDHNLADAAISAYTAYLHHQGKTQILGEEEDGIILIPAD